VCQTLNKLGRQMNILNLIKIFYKSPTVNITLNGEKLDSFSKD
jgi:hypothetical protein